MTIAITSLLTTDSLTISAYFLPIGWHGIHDILMPFHPN
ncbi:hypothetical protein NMT12_60071 [metagenome]